MIYDTDNNPIDRKTGIPSGRHSTLQNEQLPVGLEDTHQENPPTRARGPQDVANDILDDYEPIRKNVKTLAAEGCVRTLKEWLCQLDLRIENLLRVQAGELEESSRDNLDDFIDDIEAVADSDMRGYIYNIRQLCGQ